MEASPFPEPVDVAMGLPVCKACSPGDSATLGYNEYFSAAESSALQALCSQKRDFTPPAEALLSAQFHLQVSIDTSLILIILDLFCVVK